MQEELGRWVLRNVAGIAVTAGTPKTLLQYAASSTNTAEVLWSACTQSGSTTSAQDQTEIVRKTAAATVTAAAVGTDWYDVTGGAGTFCGTLSTTGTGYNASAEGTDGDVPFVPCFNVLAGYERDLQPQARIWVPASGIIALKALAVTAQTWFAAMLIHEAK